MLSLSFKKFVLFHDCSFLLQLVKKVETLEAVLMKTELAKSKLENLCREMQKAQRKSNEEHVEKLRELERNRKDMIEQFKESVAGIQVGFEIIGLFFRSTDALQILFIFNKNLN